MLIVRWRYSIDRKVVFGQCPLSLAVSSAQSQSFFKKVRQDNDLIIRFIRGIVGGLVLVEQVLSSGFCRVGLV
jgi:hypothetical protein